MKLMRQLLIVVAASLMAGCVAVPAGPYAYGPPAVVYSPYYYGPYYYGHWHRFGAERGHGRNFGRGSRHAGGHDR
jgi:hypothetical protein